MGRQSLRELLEGCDLSRATPRPPTADDAAFARLRAAVGSSLGLRAVPNFRRGCPGLAFLRRIDDETASAADVEAFEAIAAVAYFPGRSFTTRVYLLAVARRS